MIILLVPSWYLCFNFSDPSFCVTALLCAVYTLRAEKQGKRYFSLINRQERVQEPYYSLGSNKWRWIWRSLYSDDFFWKHLILILIIRDLDKLLSGWWYLIKAMLLLLLLRLRLRLLLKSSRKIFFDHAIRTTRFFILKTFATINLDLSGGGDSLL